MTSTKLNSIIHLLTSSLRGATRRGNPSLLDRHATLAMTIVFLCFCVFEFFISVSSVSAAGYGLSIYPPLLQVQVKPGKTLTQVFKIDNLTGDDKFFVARLVPFTQADLFGNPVINLQSTAPWLSYFSLANSSVKLGEPFLIKGNASEQLVLSLSVPENAPIEDLYATLLVSTYANTSGVGYQGSLVNATTGANLLITISSEAFPATLLHLEDLSITQGLVFHIGPYYLADNLTPLSFTASVLNTGDFRAETKGLFRITDRHGQPVYLEGILPVNVVAKTQRALLNDSGQAFSFSPHLGTLGPHQVSLAIKTDNANTENSLNLIFLPLKLTAGLILALIFLFTIFSPPKIVRF